jgi:glyoxylase-like metal-dependent hydrolase (beta-lactamase superfamily II)/rhodanese-related sulfurtransferase
MVLEQIYTKCLAQGAYYIEHKGEAAIIDPLRETKPYLDRLSDRGVKLKYIFETHFHADFVSGHVSLAQLTGADIVYGPGALPSFEFISALDGQTFKVGNLTIKALHTPGHTLESTCFLLSDEKDKNIAIFTGDTLFLGDVGRPDLAQKGEEITQEYLAGLLFESLRNKIMPLNNDVLVYPAHGAGSSCGKSMMDITVDTLGNQKIVNYALRADMTKDEFIQEVLEGLTAPPAYFPLNVKLNKDGYDHSSEELASQVSLLNPTEFILKSELEDVLILDVRHQNEFVEAHIPGSIFIGLDGTFAPWVGEIVKNVKQPLLIVCERGREEEAVLRLSRVGFDNVIGCLDKGISGYKDAGFETIGLNSIQASDIELYLDESHIVMDIRKPAEYNIGHLPNVFHLPLSSLQLKLKDIPTDKSILIYCAGGYRSVIAASILLQVGFSKIINISGGFAEIKETKLADSIVVEKSACSL